LRALPGSTMTIGGRKLSRIRKALSQTMHYTAAVNIFRVYEKPLDVFGRYLTSGGEYPYTIRVKTPTGPLNLLVYSWHDVQTIHEVFARIDYPACQHDKIIVDFGSNIGISAAYFLSRNSDSFAYLFEPVPANVQRLKQNLSQFENRYSLEQVAVGLTDGEEEFGLEETGRYGGLGKDTGKCISVRCRDSNMVLAHVLARHDHIDILKIDIEGLDKSVFERIPIHLARRVQKIYVEYGNHLKLTHEYIQRGNIARFVNRALNRP
jgi:FkbM family methyltransferase